MNILDRIKIFITKNRNLQLQAKNLDRTQSIIAINTIEKIIEDPEIYSKFLDYESNSDLFGQDIQLDYLIAIRDYVDFMRDKGIKFNKEQRMRIKRIEKMLPKQLKQKKKENKDKKSNYKSTNKSSLYSTAQLILNDDTTFKTFLSTQETSFNGIDISDINSFFSTEMTEFFKHFDCSRYKLQESRLHLINTKIKIAENGYQMSKEIKLNPDFEQAILKDVDTKLPPEEVAFELYNSLNSKVKYSTRYLILDPSAKAKYKKNIDEVTEEENEVICEDWAELYAYLLTKKGYTAYVKGKNHKWVEACVGETIIKADATNPFTSLEDESRMPDLIRAKLKVRPAGFEIMLPKNRTVNEFDSWKKLSRLENNYVENNDITQREILELMNLIGEQGNLSAEVFKFDKDDGIRCLMQKMNFINKLLDTAKLESSQEYGTYLLYLFRNVLDEEDRKRAVLIGGALYREVYNDYDMIPMISLYMGDEDTPIKERKEEDYKFLTFNKGEHKLSTMSKIDIIQLVAKGEIKRTSRRAL